MLALGHKIMGHSRHTTITRGLSTNTGGLLKRSWFRIHRRTACQLSCSHGVSIGVAISSPSDCLCADVAVCTALGMHARMQVLDLLRNMYKFIVVFVGNQALWAE